jgi:hypothetical protein
MPISNQVPFAASFFMMLTVLRHRLRAEFTTGPVSGRTRWESPPLPPMACIFAIQLMLGCNLTAATLYLSRNPERLASMAVIPPPYLRSVIRLKSESPRLNKVVLR